MGLSAKKIDILKHIAVIKITKNYTLELNMTSIEGRPPLYDLRRWSKDTGEPKKGLTLNRNEIWYLYKTLRTIFEEERKDETC